MFLRDFCVQLPFKLDKPFNFLSARNKTIPAAATQSAANDRCNAAKNSEEI
jgi:hypothetical protein